ncbi:IS5/IS1182 family transposase, partial [Sodalis-like symbiont of Philaenus spumarius]
MLSDDQYERISPFLPGKASEPGRTAADTRLFVEAVLWIARTGSPWRDLPPDFEEVFIDSPIVRVHQHAAGSPK